MLITMLELENWKSYGFAKIPLSPGVTAILGENGSGKSSILEAVGFALFDHRNGKLSVLLREGAKQGRVVVSLVSSVDGEEYLVEREFTAKSTTSYRVYTSANPESGIWPYRVAEGVADVQRWLRLHMGVPPDADLGTLFENTIGVPQGTFTAPFLLSLRPRKEHFNRLLRVHEYEKAAVNLRPTVRQLKDEKVALDTEIARIEGVLTVLPGLRDEGQALDSALLRLGTAQSIRKQQLSTATAELEGLRVIAEAVELARQKAEEARVVLTEQASRAARLEALRETAALASKEDEQARARLTRVRQGREKVADVESEMRAWQAKTECARSELDAMGKAQAGLSSQWAGLKKQAGFLQDAEAGACPTCGSELTADLRASIISRNEGDMALITAEQEKWGELTIDGKELLRVAQAQCDALQAKLQELPSVADLERAKAEWLRRLEAWGAATAAVTDCHEEIELSIPVLEEQIADYEQAKAGYDSEEHARVQSEVLSLRLQLGSVEVESKEKRYRLTVVKDSIKALERTEEEQIAKAGKATETSETLATIETMREILREAGPYVTRRLVRQISQGASTMFADLMGDSGRRLQWSEDYEVLLDGRGYSRTFAQLSGGEQMVAALAVRLALLRETSAIDVAFFDEPTAHLDPERRESLAGSIGQVKGFRQLFVISHDATFESAAENTIRIVKGEGGSHASTE